MENIDNNENFNSVKKEKSYPDWLNNLVHLLAGITIGWLLFKYGI